MKLNAIKFGLSFGILWALGMLVLTIVSASTGYADAFLRLFVGVYPGYGVTVGGAFFGLIDGFVDGFVGAWLVALFYNKLVG